MGLFCPPNKPFMEYMIKKTYGLALSNSPTGFINYKGALEEKREQQMHDRSKCFEPFAKAFFEANQ